MRLNLGELKLRPGGDEVGAGSLAEALVWHGHERGGRNSRVAQQEYLHFLGADLLAAAVDDVLKAPLDRD